MNRDEAWAAISDASTTWDILVIGGGATGLSIAVDAATRGHRTLLLEKQDFAAATSSRSTKLIHGGVRYLQQGNICLVREALRERDRLLTNAPHLVQSRDFIVPAYKRFDRFYYRFGLRLYDLLARKRQLGRSRKLSRDDVLAKIPNLKPDKLRGGVQYTDGQFDDARLAIALARTAWDAGARLCNYAEVIRLRHASGRVCGAEVVDRETGQSAEVRTKVVVNAAGIFVDEIRRLDDPEVENVMVVSQGSHLVLPPDALGGGTGLLIPRTQDGRVLFAVPWQNVVLLGTTDLPREKPEADPQCSADEERYLLEHAAGYLQPPPEAKQILARYAGLRPLVKKPGIDRTASLSRSHRLILSPQGLVTIAGGKWTTCRQMAEDTVDAAQKTGGLDRRLCRTTTLPLRGAGPETETVYGCDWQAVQALGTKPVDAHGEVTDGMIRYAMEHEMARNMDDVLYRRTRIGVHNQPEAERIKDRFQNQL